MRACDGWSIPTSPHCGVPDQFLTSMARPQQVGWSRPTSPQCGGNAELRACDGWSIPTSPQCAVFTSDQPGARHDYLVAPHESAMWSGVATDLLAHHQLVRNAELRACDGWSIPTSPQCGVFTSDQPSTRHGYLAALHESAMWSGVATDLLAHHQLLRNAEFRISSSQVRPGRSGLVGGAQLVRNAELWACGSFDGWSIPTSPQCGVPDSKHASEGGGVEGRRNVDTQVRKQPSTQRFIAQVINLVFPAQS